MRNRARTSFVVAGLAMTLAGCGLFGTKGAGLDKPTKSSLDPRCTAPPFELPASCPIAGIGADTTTFNDSHLYAGSPAVIPGSTNYLDIQTVNGRVKSFQEQFHANPPLTDHEARLVAHGEVPSHSKRLFAKLTAGMCDVIEYRSPVLRRMYGKEFSAVLIVLRSANPSAFDKTNVTSATISLSAPHSSASITGC